MSPVPRDAEVVLRTSARPQDPDALVIEAWAQGYMVGSLIIMAFITVANMRKGVILHKLILIELLAGIWQGFWLFPRYPIDGWWLSAAAIPLNLSWILHNIISWMKIKPFLPRQWSTVFFYSIMLSVPYWIVEMYANFAFFHDWNRGKGIFPKTRPYEPLFRDPWWIITTVYLFVIIKTQYEITLREIVRISPRFGIMLIAMVLSLVFVICDILSVTGALRMPGDTGINPFWKLSFVFKCLTDSVILDDFKVALDRLRAFKISRLGSFSGDFSDRRSRNDGTLVETWEKAAADTRGPQNRAMPPLPSPDGDYVHASNYADARPSTTTKIAFRNTNTANKHHEASQSNLDTEDMVPSALEPLPLRTLEAAHRSKSEHEWVEDVARKDENLAAEIEYASALQDIQQHSPPISPKAAAAPRPP